MSDVYSTQAKAVVPVIDPDAAEYAMNEGIEGVVHRLAEATARIYSAAQGIRVLLRPDPEIRDYWFVIFEVRILSADLPDWREASHRWHLEYLQAYPYPRNHVLISRIIVEDE